MKSREIARRYAEALYELAREEGIVDEIESAYSEVVRKLSAVSDALRFLEHPLVPRERKITFLAQAFPDIPAYLHNLFVLLVRNGRAGYLPLIYDQFRTLRGEQERIVRVQVATAQPLLPADRSRLIKHLERALTSKVDLEERVDPALLGGARLELDGKVIDGTLRAKLAQLRAVLAG